jgi:hypothetical protein
VSSANPVYLQKGLKFYTLLFFRLTFIAFPVVLFWLNELEESARTFIFIALLVAYAALFFVVLTRPISIKLDQDYITAFYLNRLEKTALAQINEISLPFTVKTAVVLSVHLLVTTSI